MGKKKEQVVRGAVNNRTYSYAKGGVVLNFGLNVDNNVQRLDFIECLKQALVDLEKEVTE